VVTPARKRIVQIQDILNLDGGLYNLFHRCPASSPSGTSSPIQGSHLLFLPSSVPCSSSRPEQGVYPLCTSVEVRLPTSAISSSVQAPPTEVPYQTVVSPSRPLLPHGAPPSEPSPLEDHFSPLYLPAMVSPIRVDRLELVSIWGSTLHLSRSNLPQVTYPLPCFNRRLSTPTCRMNCIKEG